MWYILKLGYQSPGAASSKTALLGYSHLGDARRVFDHLELGYQLASAVRVKGGRTITVTALSLHESFKDNYQDALDAVDRGDTTVMDEARELDIEIP